MVHVPRHRRLIALAIVAVTNLGFYLLPARLLSSEKAAILVSMVIAVAVAFVISAFSNVIRLKRMMYKYVFSGVVGIMVGAVFFFLLKSSAILTMGWVNTKGKLLLIALNFVAALYLFFARHSKKSTSKTAAAGAETRDVGAAAQEAEQASVPEEAERRGKEAVPGNAEEKTPEDEDPT